MPDDLDLARLDAEWDKLTELRPAAAAPLETASLGAFGHESERRLGLRARASFWALLSGGHCGVYARVVDLSTTGVLLELLPAAAPFNDAGRLTLDLFVPEAPLPVHAVVRKVRGSGALVAFEFTEMRPDDRLTLAEHLDATRRGSIGEAPIDPRSSRAQSSGATLSWLFTATAPPSKAFSAAAARSP